MKRTLLVAAAFLLAGAVVNVGVAWGCEAWSRPKEPWRHYPRKGTVDPPLPYEYVVLERRGVGLGIESTLYTRLRLEIGTGFSLPFLMRTRSGWPSLAMTGEIEDTRPGQTWPPVWNRITHAFAVKSDAVWRHPRGLVVLPLRPIWPGFAVNTLFYAAALWLPTGGPFRLRRLVRTKRGLCPACAYPMGDSEVCSECGKALPGAPT